VIVRHLFRTGALSLRPDFWRRVRRKGLRLLKFVSPFLSLFDVFIGRFVPRVLVDWGLHLRLRGLFSLTKLLFGGALFGHQISPLKNYQP
jgi:hypothetical protein